MLPLPILLHAGYSVKLKKISNFKVFAKKISFFNFPLPHPKNQHAKYQTTI